LGKRDGQAFVADDRADDRRVEHDDMR